MHHADSLHECWKLCSILKVGILGALKATPGFQIELNNLAGSSDYEESVYKLRKMAIDIVAMASK